MKKAEARKKLLAMFQESSVEAFLARYPDDHTFGIGLIDDFINYINSLPAPGRLPEEDWQY